MTDAERLRLADADAGRLPWRRFGPYVAERAWGSVREDYSADGDAWRSFPFEHARSRTYRWNEDGMSAWSDDRQNVCLGIALWNGADPFLKERYFGLSGPQGNHGEDAKDYWWYVDGTPTHSFHRTRYAYPLRAFPYDDLAETNASRGRDAPEYELLDTGVFDGDDYVMVTSDWAKATPEDLCLSIEVHNRSDHDATVHLLPTVWFRNTWSWQDGGPERPRLWADGAVLRGRHPALGDFTVVSDVAADSPHGPGSGHDEAPVRLLFCENETNVRRLYGTETWAGRPATAFPKDGINDHVVSGAATVNPHQTGTKAAFDHVLTIPAGACRRVRMRWRLGTDPGPLGEDFAATLAARQRESDEFWAGVFPDATAEDAHIGRQALAGLLCSKQYYPYEVRRWLAGDPTQPAPPSGHREVRNAGWWHLAADDVILMPDPWEYPWFAAWDLACHCVALALIDPEGAKEQLLLLLGERYLHPSGDIPAYEWNFSDTNPPVQAWAALQVYHLTGGTDRAFLERAMHKLLINFTWWVNRKDVNGNNLFEGGFLGLDNIGAFDRSADLPDGRTREQSDGTAWMAMYCLDMLQIALALRGDDHTFDGLAVKFLDHFCYICDAAHELGLWEESAGFYYDHIRRRDGRVTAIPIRSMVGLIPLTAVTALDDDVLATMPAIRERLDWFAANRPELLDRGFVDTARYPTLLGMVDGDRLPRLLAAMLDPGEFLSDHGLRSMSAAHREHPAVVRLDGREATVDYEPAESRTPLFGGNSNWRGPVWFPVNALLLSGLRRYDAGSGRRISAEMPTGSGTRLPLGEIADRLADRLIGLFRRGPDGRRPGQRTLPWQDDIQFHEYFDGDTGAGLGASHQTGWTALVAVLIRGWPR